MPRGADGCLEGLTFCISGTLDSLDRCGAPGAAAASRGLGAVCHVMSAANDALYKHISPGMVSHCRVNLCAKKEELE